jgi:type IV secretory pathway VirJ component
MGRRAIMPTMRALAWMFVVAALLQLPGGAFAAEEALRYGRVGTVTLYHRTPRPPHVALFISGDGGWNLGVVDMARELAGLDALVIGIDIRTFLRSLERATEPCAYPAADLEALSKFVQKKLGYMEYVPPVLVGYSSGATLVYAVLVQAPAGTFRGAISLGFCPDLELTRPLCRGDGGLAWKTPAKGKGYLFLPAPGLETPWVALQGAIDQVCSPADTAAFVRQSGRAEIVLLPKVGHGFAVPRNWLPQFKEEFGRLAHRAEAEPSPETAQPAAGRPAPIAGLPMVEVPSPVARKTLVVLLTGDGGWAGIDREIASTLAAGGLPVAGLNTLQYFWNAKTPDTAGRDLERILRHYLDAWQCQQAVLVGYSFGASVLPFMAARLPRELLARIALIALIGPDKEAEFEFHILDWIPGSAVRGLPVLPEIERLSGTRVLCIQGEDERDSLCRRLRPEQGRVITLKGGHHLGGDYRGLARQILAAVP